MRMVRFLVLYSRNKLWWDGLDSNQLRFYVSDLQSDAHPPSEQPPQNSLLVTAIQHLPFRGVDLIG